MDPSYVKDGYLVRRHQVAPPSLPTDTSRCPQVNPKAPGHTEWTLDPDLNSALERVCNFGESYILLKGGSFLTPRCWLNSIKVLCLSRFSAVSAKTQDDERE